MDIDQDSPLRLAVAARLAFPDGTMTASGLSREARRGRLEVWLIANRSYTSLAAIKRMLDRCRVTQSPRASGSIGEKAAKPHGSSSTKVASTQQDVLKAIMQERKERSRRMSPATRPQTGPTPILLAFPSPQS